MLKAALYISTMGNIFWVILLFSFEENLTRCLKGFIVSVEGGKMKLEQIELLKAELEKHGLCASTWQIWLNNASETCFCLARVLEETEPYAQQTINVLKEASDVLCTHAEIS